MKAKLSSKNQIVIPTEARKTLQVKSGEAICLVPKGNAVILYKYKSAQQLQGILKINSTEKSILHTIYAVRKEFKF